MAQFAKGDHVLYFDAEDAAGKIGHYLGDDGDKHRIQLADGGEQSLAFRGKDDAARDGQGLTFRAV